METLTKEERLCAEVAAELYQFRTQLDLSQRALAPKSGTSVSVICKLENADYEGDSLDVLRRIAAALNKQVQGSFKPLQKQPVEFSARIPTSSSSLAIWSRDGAGAGE